MDEDEDGDADDDMVFLWWCFLCWCSGVFVVVWWCFCGGVLVVV